MDEHDVWIQPAECPRDADAGARVEIEPVEPDRQRPMKGVLEGRRFAPGVPEVGPADGARTRSRSTTHVDHVEPDVLRERVQDRRVVRRRAVRDGHDRRRGSVGHRDGSASPVR